MRPTTSNARASKALCTSWLHQNQLVENVGRITGEGVRRLQRHRKLVLEM